MKSQIPCGPDDEMCHRLWEVCSKVCYNPETKVKCKLWKEFCGTDATGQECNGWFCVDEMTANMIMEVAKETRQAGAATESFRNEFVKLGRTRLMQQQIGAMNGGSLPLIDVVQ